MSRTLTLVSSYDAVILDVQPPDMRGSEAFLKLREAQPTARMIMMAEFGYDGTIPWSNAGKTG